MNPASLFTFAASVLILVVAFCIVVGCVFAYRKYRAFNAALKVAIDEKKAEMDTDRKLASELAQKRQRAIERNRELDAAAEIERKARDAERWAAEKRERIELAKVAFREYNRSDWPHGVGYSATGIQMYYDKYTDDLVEKREQLTAAPTEVTDNSK